MHARPQPAPDSARRNTNAIPLTTRREPQNARRQPRATHIQLECAPLRNAAPGRLHRSVRLARTQTSRFRSLFVARGGLVSGRLRAADGSRHLLPTIAVTVKRSYTKTETSVISRIPLESSHVIDVSFQHWRYVLKEEELIRYGSPHFDRKTAGQALSAAVMAGASNEASCDLLFDEKLILSANEVFPEAAVADPLADLEVWDEWRSGIRSFPYPGRYGRLGIRRQDTKTNSTSSTGVLGEIVTGLFAQAGIAPWVLVRVIRRWPDFIFYLRGDRYAFVEAKAYTGEMAGSSVTGLHIPQGLFSDCVVDAVHQLNADPFVQVWGAFTHIIQIAPMRLKVTFLELNADASRRSSIQKRVLPQAVLLGIAERALRRAITDVEERDLAPLKRADRKPSKYERNQLERVLVPAAMRQLEDLLVEENIRTAVLASPKLFEIELKKMIRGASIPEQGEGYRMFSARERASSGTLSYVRGTGPHALYVGDISPVEQTSISANWTSNWQNANQPWKRIDSVDIWRCGGAFFAIGEDRLNAVQFRG